MITPTRREAIARIVDPRAFELWQASYNYGLKRGDTPEEAKATADHFNKKSCEAALSKADEIMALSAPAEPGKEGDHG